MSDTISQERLRGVRHVVSRMLGLRPGHSGEAVAAALGFNTHAALGAALRADGTMARTPDARRFRARLAELGHERAASDADASLTVSLGVIPKGVSDRNALTDLLGISNLVASARMELAVEQPAARDFLLALSPIPDLTVPTMVIGKDTLRWKPGFVRSLLFDELKFLLAAAALHRALAHPLRPGERDPGLWRVACDHVVNHFLVQEKIGELPISGFYNPRYPSSMPAEEVYEQLAGEPGCLRGQSIFHYEPWKAKAPASPPTVAQLADGRLRRIQRHDAFDMLWHGSPNRGWTPGRRTVARTAKANTSKGNHMDGKSASFGRHLARLVADLPEHERAQAVSVALEQVRDAYTSARFDDLRKGLHPALRA